MKVTVINSGSSSIKYEVFDAGNFVMLASGLVEKIGTNDGRLLQRRRKDDGTFDEQSMSAPLADHRAGFELMEDVNRDAPLLGDGSGLLGIGHRVVHGGEHFREPALINDDVIDAIRGLIPLAPLHNPSNLLGIEVTRERFPRVPQVAVFDTAFHQTMPPYAYRYAVPHELYEKHAVRKYGFHGSSHSYVSKEAARHLGIALERANLIVLHLGNGASAAAVQGGRSIDTSMGMTPLEGLVMGTRSGDIDPSLPFYIIRRTGMKPEDVESLLNRESGLKGICGVSDMREIMDRAATGDERAALAIEMFCYRIRKCIGAYYAVLRRLDAVVFTGGIGENASPIRLRVCEGLEHLGIAIDPGKNSAAGGAVAETQREGMPVKVLVVRTNEEREIAEQTVRTIEMAKGRSQPRNTNTLM
ncbi:MAG: acetate kinase [Nitrospirae bacterium]|nr:acetate kinase [Nitrospirota bacterium]NTW65073.1 acetate kinase [Nitrospirota bacterium]